MMLINWKPIYALNLFLCGLIMILGLICYRLHKSKFYLIISASFFLFGLSHLLLLLGITKNQENVLIIASIRVLAYLLFILSMCKIAQKK